jgi:hypothetical protein
MMMFQPRAGKDRCREEKIFFFPPEFEPQTIQPIASHYNDYTTLALIISITKN